MKTPAEVKPLLLEAIRAARNSGLKVAPGRWGIKYAFDGDRTWEKDVSPCLCPMGCVIIGKPVGGGSRDKDLANKLFDAAHALGITPNAVESFIYGFDGEEAECDTNPEFYELGMDLADMHWEGTL